LLALGRFDDARCEIADPKLSIVGESCVVSSWQSKQRRHASAA
jgi:hypothetical protein